MNPTEREEWLRERGVVIESPNDRRQAESILSGLADDRPPSIVEQVQSLSITEEGIKFVYIPHDTSKPISTLVLPKRLVDALGPSGDIVPTYVKSYFADGKSIDNTLFKNRLRRI